MHVPGGLFQDNRHFTAGRVLEEEVKVLLLATVQKCLAVSGEEGDHNEEQKVRWLGKDIVHRLQPLVSSQGT